MQSPALVSVMIPYYNCKEYIAETIESVKQQTYPNIEIIIVDDGSTEEDTAYLQTYLSDKPQIKFEQQNNQGVAAARNHAARLATGKYFLFLDADDVILPEYIAKAVEVLETNPECKLVYPQAELFGAQTGKWEIPEYAGIKSLLLGNKFPSSISIHRATDHHALQGFDESFRSHEDWDYWIRLLADGGEVYRIPEVLFRYRKRPDQSSLIDTLISHPEQIIQDWQHIYLKHSSLFVKHNLSYWGLVQQVSQYQELEQTNLSLRAEIMSFEKQNQELQAILERILQQAEESNKQITHLQNQIIDLTKQVENQQQFSLKLKNAQKQVAELQARVEHLTVERDSLAQHAQNLDHNRADLEHHLHEEMQRFTKYKGLWTTQLLKPLIQTEKAISSANRYRKGFRLLVREKGSIGKAYQFLRHNYKQNKSIRTLKHILKFAGATQPVPQAPLPPMPEILAKAVSKPAEQICGLKVAIIAEMSIPQCKKYRVTQKQEMFEAMGIPCSVTSWTDYDEARKQISLASVVIFYRVPGFDSVMNLIEECHRLKIKTLWDVDDLIFDEEILKTSSTINSLDKAERDGVINGARLYRKAMLACDVGIASTPGLAKAMQEAGLPTVHIIENALDEETLQTAQKINSRTKPSDDIIRIIYGSGTKTHNIDFMEAAPALAQVLKDHPNVHFRYIGFLELPEYFDNVKSQIEHIPFCNYTEYLSHLAECDISIAPLENFIFNDAKSNIKYLEASITKLASVCSPRAAFADVIEHGKTGMLADNKAQWIEAFEALVTNSVLRKQMAEAAFENITQRYSPTHIGEGLAETIYSDAFDQQTKTKVLTFNVYYYPQSFGGATIVAEQINQLLAKDNKHEIFAVTTLPVTHYLPAYHTIRYEYNGVTVFGVAVPPEESASYANPRFKEVVAEIIELVQPDIAHIHCIQGIGYGIIETCKQYQIKTIVTLHDAWWICPNQFMLKENKFLSIQEWDKEPFEYRKLLVNALTQNDLIVAPSAYFADLHQNYLKHNVSVNKNGVMQPQQKIEKRKPKTIRFGYVGGMTEIKGVHLILEAFKKHNFANTQLVVVDNMLNMGSQSFFDEQFQGITNYKIVPAYNQSNIDQFFADIDVLLFPTQWKESFGLTVREAMLRDVWVIATDAGGVAEDIIDGKNGTVIPFTSDAETLSQAIRDVCERYQSLEDDSIIDLPKSHIRTFEEQKDELVKMYDSLLNQ